MADILIRMEMPKNCASCDFSSVVPGEVWCKRAKEIVPEEQAIDVNRHPAFCPLHELPEHGDLISKDDAMNAILGEPPEAHYPSWYASIVNEIPAIVPSNKEDAK